jgi:hypothetical protein
MSYDQLKERYKTQILYHVNKCRVTCIATCFQCKLNTLLNILNTNKWCLVFVMSNFVLNMIFSSTQFFFYCINKNNSHAFFTYQRYQDLEFKFCVRIRELNSEDWYRNIKIHLKWLYAPLGQFNLIDRLSSPSAPQKLAHPNFFYFVKITFSGIFGIGPRCNEVFWTELKIDPGFIFQRWILNLRSFFSVENWDWGSLKIYPGSFFNSFADTFNLNFWWP